MKEMHLRVYAGLGARLVPIISCLRLCSKHNLKLIIYWDSCRFRDLPFLDDQSKTPGFQDLFQEPYIEHKSVEQLELGDSIPIRDYWKIYENLHKNKIDFNQLKNQPLFIDIPTNFIGDINDDLSGLKPWPRTPGIVKETKFLKEMRPWFRKLVPVPEISSRINEVTSKFKGKKVLGLHIRGSDRPRPSFDKIYRRLDELLETYSKFFLGTDMQYVEDYLKRKYKNRIIVFENYFGSYQDKFENNNIQLKNAVVDMFCLSECDYVLSGTAFGTSFAFMAWLLGKESTYEICER